MLTVLFVANVAGGSSDTLVTVLASGLGSGALVLVGQLLLRRQQRDSLIASASDEVASAAKGLLAEYRRELEKAQREIVALRERVAKLEEALRHSQADVERIEEERQKALADLARTQEHVKQLEGKVETLERTTERRGNRRRLEGNA